MANDEGLIQSASEEDLKALHNALADIFIKRIKDRSATPADLNAARQFLKDNAITCDGPRSGKLKSLVNSLDEYPALEDMQ